jgi:hypothetical protein
MGEFLATLFTDLSGGVAAPRGIRIVLDTFILILLHLRAAIVRLHTYHIL